MASKKAPAPSKSKSESESESESLRHLVDIPSTRQSLLFEVDLATILKHVTSVPFLCAMVSFALTLKVGGWSARTVNYQRWHLY